MRHPARLTVLMVPEGYTAKIDVIFTTECDNRPLYVRHDSCFIVSDQEKMRLTSRTHLHIRFDNVAQFMLRLPSWTGKEGMSAWPAFHSQVGNLLCSISP